MTQQDFMDVYILLVSGAAKLKNGKEVCGLNCYDNITFEFPNLTPDYVIVRSYYGNGSIYYKEEWRNYKQTGKFLRWCINGNKEVEIDYKNGKANGKYLSWYDNGKKLADAEFKNDYLHGKYMRWDHNGNILEDGEYRNGVKIK